MIKIIIGIPKTFPEGIIKDLGYNCICPDMFLYHPKDKISWIEENLKNIHEPIITFDPYILQACRFYSCRYKLESDCKYFLYNPEEENSLKDITGDLNQAFTLLAEPLGEIMNIDLERKTYENL